jgi:DNA-binding response OmpR family regulator
VSLPALLIVDDDLSLLEILPDTLHVQMPSARIDIAASPRDALDALKRTHYDVILSDVRMPQMGGFQFMEEARTISSDTPVLMMTGIGDPGLALRALNAGAFDFIVKPFDRHDLRESVRVALRCHALREKISRYRSRLVRLSAQYTRLHALYHFRDRPPLENIKNSGARLALETSYAIMRNTIGHYEAATELMRRRIDALESSVQHARMRLENLEQKARRRALSRLVSPLVG